MGRGGVCVITSFIAGNIVAAVFRHYHAIEINSIAIFSIQTLILTTLILPLYRTPLPYLKNSLLFLCCTVIFLSGVSNMQRVPPEIKQNPSITKIKETFTSKAAQIVEKPDDLAVLAAFTFGDKTLLDHEIKKAYRNSGAMHILALSGLHIGIIYSILNILLSFLEIHYTLQRPKFAICTIIILAYAIITGFSASVQRAAIMITTWKALSLSGRKCSKWEVLLLSASIILLINPQELTNIGFQLSFAAVAGITCLYPTLSSAMDILQKYRIHKYIRPVWNMLCISIACQIATAPLVGYYFHNFSFFFLITNLVAIPLVTISLYIFVISLLTHSIPLIGNISEIMIQLAVNLLNSFIRYIGM